MNPLLYTPGEKRYNTNVWMPTKYCKYIKLGDKQMCKIFVHAKKKKDEFAPLLLGPADLGNIIMFS